MSCGISDLEEDLACPICLELYSAAQGSSPKILVACGHTICENCVQKLPAENSAIKCPICNTQTMRHSTNSLPTNFSLREVASKFSKVDDGLQICLSCQNRHMETNFWYCQQCESENPGGVSWACSHCAIKYHKDHTLVEFEAVKTRKEEIEKRIRMERDLMAEELARVMDSNRESAEIQKTIKDLLDENSTQQFELMEDQLNANREILSSGLVGLESLGKKSNQMWTELEEACRETIEAQAKARKVMNHCLSNLRARFQKVKDDANQKKKEKVVDSSISFKIVGEDCFVHQGFGLMDLELAEATTQKFRLRRPAKVIELYELIAQHYKLKPLEEFRLWSFKTKSGKILWPIQMNLMDPTKVEEELHGKKILVWMELQDEMEKVPLPQFNSDSDVLVFLKYYDPKQSLVTFCGHIVLRLNSHLREVILELCRRAHLLRNSELQVFQEMEPGKVEPWEVDMLFQEAFTGPMLDDGLILVFQQTPIPIGVPFPTAADYFKDLVHQLVVEFVNKEDPSAPAIQISASQIWQYDQVVAALSQKVIHDPEKIQLYRANQWRDTHGRIIPYWSDLPLHIMLGIGSQPRYIPPHIKHRLYYCLQTEKLGNWVEWAI